MSAVLHIFEKCLKQGAHVSTAESCTGGMIASRIVDLAGVSEIYEQGFVTYSNEAKESLLGVSHETLAQFGAVSRETAKEMAEGCAKAAHAEYAVVTTGIAGPGGGSEEKPVGLVYIGCFVKGTVTTYRNVFSGDRSSIRKAAASRALELLDLLIPDEEL